MSETLMEQLESDNARVLVVDDEPAVRELIARHFRRMGKQVAVAESAEEVHKRGHTRREWDVVVTDVHLPGISGIELARRMSRRADSLVLVTGDHDGDLAEEAMRNLRAGYLLKPFELFELDAAVRLAGGTLAPKKRRMQKLRALLRKLWPSATIEPIRLVSRVPLRAVLLSIAALSAPILSTALPGITQTQELLIWVAALIPPFLLAYYRGWGGAAVALALGMAALASVQSVAEISRTTLPDSPILVGMIVTFIMTCLGAGWLSDTLLRHKLQAEANALTDSLTGLANRPHVLRFLESRFAAAQRGKGQLAVVFFDLDHLKRWNDELGHEAGDAGIVAFADVLRRNMRNMDLAGRYGGEEFVSVLTGSDFAGTMVYANRVREQLRTVELYGRKLSVSVGVAMYHPDMRRVPDILNAADAAMYTAKSAGRDCIRVFSKEEGDSAPASLVLSA